MLLHLLDKNKVNIYDIPIVDITNQYLEYIAEMKRNDLNVMSEFLVMAATLIDIKSRMLLPAVQTEDEEVEDPRTELVQQLLEYKMYKCMAYELRDRLVAQGCRVKVDDTDKSPGWKFSECEMRGVPFRIEIGPKDIENNKCVFVRRDTREKIEVSLDEVEVKTAELLETIHKDMYEAAKAHMEEHTYAATSWEQFCDIVNTKPGFVKSMWCGEQACEDKIKEELAATSRCMPFEQENLGDTCVCCGKPAKKMVYWGRAY